MHAKMFLNNSIIVMTHEIVLKKALSKAFLSLGDENLIFSFLFALYFIDKWIKGCHGVKTWREVLQQKIFFKFPHLVHHDKKFKLVLPPKRENN